MTSAPRACATAAIAGMSGISKDCEPGASTSTALVFGLNNLVDAGADQGIEIAGFDAVAGQHAVAEIARRAVGIVADQDMIAGLQHREQGGGDRRQARGRKPDARALRAFERHQRLLQRLRGRGSAAAILELAAMGVQIVRRRIEHGGTVDHRRIDESFLRLGVAARRHQRGFGLLRLRCADDRKNSCVRRYQSPFAATATYRRENRPGLLITGHRRGRQPLDPARQSFCDARQLFSRRTLRGLPRPSIHA